MTTSPLPFCCHSSRREADKAWQRAEARLAEGRVGDPRRGRQTFRRYATEEWLPHHVMEVSTRESYTYQLNKHILPWFGPMRMIEIMPAAVREWVTDLQAKGVSPATIQKVRFILSAIFTTALNDVTHLHNSTTVHRWAEHVGGDSARITSWRRGMS